MEQNKTGKYLKYAIGEIVLVVIGILIALQVSNWNQQRVEQNTMNAYYAKLATTLEADIKEQRSSIEQLNSIADHLMRCLEILNTKDESDQVVIRKKSTIKKDVAEKDTGKQAAIETTVTEKSAPKENDDKNESIPVARKKSAPRKKAAPRKKSVAVKKSTATASQKKTSEPVKKKTATQKKRRGIRLNPGLEIE